MGILKECIYVSGFSRQLITLHGRGSLARTRFTHLYNGRHAAISNCRARNGRPSFTLLYRVTSCFKMAASCLLNHRSRHTRNGRTFHRSGTGFGHECSTLSGRLHTIISSAFSSICILLSQYVGTRGTTRLTLCHRLFSRLRANHNRVGDVLTSYKKSLTNTFPRVVRGRGALGTGATSILSDLLRTSITTLGSDGGWPFNLHSNTNLFI